MALSGVAAGTLAVGGLLVWSGLKGSSVLGALQDVIGGKQPSGSNAYPIDITAATGAGTTSSQSLIGTASGNQIVAIAASYKGKCYSMGGGHGAPCAGNCWDCSGYVSCVLNKAGVMKGTMATGGLAGWGVGVTYANRQPGDIIVWNGGTGGGHTGIIIDGSHMWNNPCTKCGGVQISSYPYGSRSASSAVIRRAK